MEWVEALRKSDSQPSVQTNPALKLLDFFERKYGGAEGNGEEGETAVLFSTVKAEDRSKKLKEGVDVIKNGYVEGFLKVWRGKWSV